MSITIAQATRADLPEVAPLFDLYRQFYQQPSDVAAALRFLEQRVARDESVVFLARDERRHAVGFTQLYPLYCSVALRPQWLLYDLYVLPEFRRAGVARGLLDRAKQLGVETASHALFLETANDNLGAQRLYESAGWEREARFVKFNLVLPGGRS
jgi:ribosomal protein S18 acetylase RimI-like enzyme